jgi:ribosome-binding protein aMBF1 (putative translation factor)
MPAATKTPLIKLTLRAGTPRRVLQELRRRYSPYILEREDLAVDYFETTQSKKTAKTLTPALWLKHLRNAHGLSQASLGEKLGGVKPARISDYENSHRAISKDIAKSLSRVFGVSTDRFL